MIFSDNDKRKRAIELTNEGLALAQQKNDLEGALKQFLKAIDVDPDYADAYHNAGQCYRLTGRYEQAVNYYSRALQIAPENAIGLHALGTTYLEMKQFEKALEYFQQLLNHPGLDALNLREQVQRSVMSLRVIVIVRKFTADKSRVPQPSGPPSPEIEQIIDKALALQQAGDVGESIALLDKAIESDPGQRKLYQLRGTGYMVAGRYDHAATDLLRSVMMDIHDSAEAAVNLGGVLRQVGQPAMALIYYDLALSQQPQNAEFYVQRGQAHREAGNSEKAIHDFDEAIILNPSDDAAFYYRGLVQNAAGQLAAALADYEAALRLNPDHNTVYAARAIAYATLGRFHEGIADLELYIQRGGEGDLPLDQAKHYLTMMRQQTG